LGLLLLIPWPASAGLRGLILTSPGVFHDYAFQSQAIAQAIAARSGMRFDVSLSEHQRWETTEFSRGYDVLIYNICMANNRNEKLIANLRRQTEELGVPAVVIHCSLHSFRDTNSWWPFVGLRTRSHEPLRPMEQRRVGEHPVLDGIPADWRIADDELYINLAFDAQPLLTSRGEKGATHVTAWLKMHGESAVFGTTLGHTRTTLEDPAFQQLLANAVLYLTGQSGQFSSGRPQDAIDKVSAAPGVEYLSPEGVDCALSKLRGAVAPCYIGCVLHPLLWGEQAVTCKEHCVADAPSTDELAAICTRP